MMTHVNTAANTTTDEESLIVEVKKHMYDTKCVFYKDSVRKRRVRGLIV